jgi:hypothetical protein
MHMINKGRFKWLTKGDVVGQMNCVHKLFGVLRDSTQTPSLSLLAISQRNPGAGNFLYLNCDRAVRRYFDARPDLETDVGRICLNRAIWPVPRLGARPSANARFEKLITCDHSFVCRLRRRPSIFLSGSR